MNFNDFLLLLFLIFVSLTIIIRRGTQSPYVSNRLSQQQRQPLRSQSRERPVPRERSTSRERSRLSLARGRSSSQESLSRNRERSLSRDRRPPSSSSLHRQSQSPAGMYRKLMKFRFNELKILHLCVKIEQEFRN